MRFGFFLCLTFASFLTYAVSDVDRDQIQQRISPVGEVRVTETSSTPSTPTIEQIKKPEVAKVRGQDTYEQFCQTCHRDGLAGAPKFRDEAEWKPRLTKGMPVLIANATKGINAMPPKGTCVDCSEDDLKAAIEYMVPKK